MNESQKLIINNLNYRFKNTGLLELALTHRSAQSVNNERLEYLGDAILGFIIAEALFHKFDDGPEGFLTRQRAALVKKETLALLARQLDLGELILLGDGERKSGGWRRDSILANTLEALIGAVYLDSSFDRCREFVLDLYSELIRAASLKDSAKDSKTALQEFLQARKQVLPDYKVLSEQGEAHNKVFTIECYLESFDATFSASGKSKRIAEQSAAQKALEFIQARS